MRIDRHNGYALAADKLAMWLVATMLASLVLVLALFLTRPPQVEVWMLWARYTARLSFFLFLASYLAGPLYELSEHEAITWLRRNRRNAGISFGLAHTIHLGALVGFFVVSGGALAPGTVIVGGGAYVAMFAMLASSNDAAIRKIGARNWRRLHKFGAHYIAFVFVFTYTSSLAAPWSKPILLIALAWAAILLRIYITMSSRKRSAT